MRLLRVLARTTLWLLLATVVLSAFMRLSQAGLDCADWPDCYGATFRSQPALVGTESTATAQSPGIVAARVAHRIVASAALVLILSMVLIAWSARPRPTAAAWLASLLLLLALALAALGVITPGARLPAVGTGNLLGGFVALAVAWRLVSKLAPAGQRTVDPTLRLGAGIVLALLAIQLASGALVSTSFAALSCHAIAECQQAASASDWPWATLSPWHPPTFSPLAPHVNVDGAIVQWIHRLGSIVVGLAVAALGLMAMLRGRVPAGLILLSLVGLHLMLAHFALTGGLPLPAAMLHNLGAVALLAAVVHQL